MDRVAALIAELETNTTKEQSSCNIIITASQIYIFYPKYFIANIDDKAFNLTSQQNLCDLLILRLLLIIISSIENRVTSMYVYMYVCMYVCMYECMYVCMYIYVDGWMHACIQ